MSIFKHYGIKPFKDSSFWILLASNIITALFALFEGWNILTMLRVYWFQSVMIGAFNFIRILQLKEFSTEGFTMNGKPLQSTRNSKLHVAFFFLFHYGIFHVVYFLFLFLDPLIEVYGETPDSVHSKYVFLSALLFFGTHLFSYTYNRPRDTKKQNIGVLMLYPYERIIPMHVTMVLSVFFKEAVFLFLILKTIADVSMHSLEHNVIRKGEVSKFPQGGVA